MPIFRPRPIDVGMANLPGASLEQLFRLAEQNAAKRSAEQYAYLQNKQQQELENMLATTGLTRAQTANALANAYATGVGGKATEIANVAPYREGRPFNIDVAERQLDLEKEKLRLQQEGLNATSEEQRRRDLNVLHSNLIQENADLYKVLDRLNEIAADWQQRLNSPDPTVQQQAVNALRLAEQKRKNIQTKIANNNIRQQVIQEELFPLPPPSPEPQLMSQMVEQPQSAPKVIYDPVEAAKLGLEPRQPGSPMGYNIPAKVPQKAGAGHFFASGASEGAGGGFFGGLVGGAGAPVATKFIGKAIPAVTLGELAGTAVESWTSDKFNDPAYADYLATNWKNAATASTLGQLAGATGAHYLLKGGKSLWGKLQKPKPAAPTPQPKPTPKNIQQLPKSEVNLGNWKSGPIYIEPPPNFKLSSNIKPISEPTGLGKLIINPTTPQEQQALLNQIVVPSKYSGSLSVAKPVAKPIKPPKQNVNKPNKRVAK